MLAVILNERNKEVGRLREQINAKNKEYENILAQNDDLNEKMQSVEKKEERIRLFVKEIIARFPPGSEKK